MKMRSTVMALAMMVAGSLLAQDPVSKTVPPKGYASIEVLWPNGAPGAVGTTSDDVPKLYCYPAAGDGPHSAVVVLPGGGYTSLVMEKEGAAEARWLNEHGVSAYVLQYRLGPTYLYPYPLSDGQRAVRFVRAHAAAWKLKPDAIGVWGFSAGGHLAGYLATADPHGDAKFHPESTPEENLQRSEVFVVDDVDKLSAHPDFAILSYAGLSLYPNLDGAGSKQEGLLGKDQSQKKIDAVSPVLHVTKDSSPSFIYANEFDEKVNSGNATAFFDALHKAGVPAELHVFELGPHGTGMGQNLPKLQELAIWPLLLEHWLQIRGVIAP